MGAATKQFVAIGPKHSHRAHMAVECLARDAQLSAEVAHLGAGLAHGGLAGRNDRVH